MAPFLAGPNNSLLSFSLKGRRSLGRPGRAGISHDRAVTRKISVAHNAQDDEVSLIPGGTLIATHLDEFK
jgi:hypothetical protein